MQRPMKRHVKGAYPGAFLDKKASEKLAERSGVKMVSRPESQGDIEGRNPSMVMGKQV